MYHFVKKSDVGFRRGSKNVYPFCTFLKILFFLNLVIFPHSLLQVMFCARLLQ